MYADSKAPDAKDWALPLLVAGASITLSMQAESAGPLPALGMVAGGVGLVWAAVNGVRQWLYENETLRGLRDDREFRHSSNYRAELITRMDRDQLKAWERGARPMMSTVPTPRGGVRLLYGESVYEYTLWFILTHSDNEHVQPVHLYKEGAYSFDVLGFRDFDDYTQAREFTAFLCRMGWAEEGRGNKSARWINGMNPEKALEYFGLDRESYADQG